MVRRNTWHRYAVKDELMKLGHPTAEELYIVLKDKYPEMSRATVYRNLKILEESALAVRVIGGVEGGERFDATMEPHYHFICLKCGVAYDIKDEYRATDDAEISKKHNVEIVMHRKNYYGYCEKCAKKERQ
ncbi:MAG: transcriptional repressor [Clostridiales bacterium]|jgi:Fur family peroxide stress response transcriptional regulator|nr:transcriptional repressor [Clostridiales bacterium]